MNLQKFVTDAINEKLAKMPALAGADLSAVAVEVPKVREFGDFAVNAAMVLARPLKQNPRVIAEIILPEISALAFVADASVAGPGFINIRLKDDFVLESINQKSEIRNQKSLTIDLDYGGYNVGKDLHVGHFRTTVVGDTFNRIAKYLGHKTKSYNHLGDWGRPMGLIIAWIMEYGMPNSAAELNKMYPLSTARAKDDEKWMERAQKITAELQSGNAEYRKIYDAFMKITLDQMDEILQRLNIMPFDMNMGERGLSEYVPELQKILESRGLLTESDGALVINVKQDDDTAPMPPVMFRYSSGANGYHAADLTAIYYRDKTDKPDAIYYFVDNRQTLHFTQIFRAAKLAKITGADLWNAGYGTINGPDGKPLKTRDGGAASLSDILNMVDDAARKRVKEAGKNLPDDAVKMIALAALKFNDLMHDLKSDYILDPDIVTQFEGRTGPYILYTAVRLGSIIKRVGAHDCAPGVPRTPLHPDERNLLLTLLDFDRIVQTAFDKRATDLLANYAYDLCQDINAFYHNCPILRDDVGEATRAHRLAIVHAALTVLSNAIDLMGLKIPDEM